MYFGLVFLCDVFFKISLLQFVLDRWWSHVVAMSRVLQLTVISGADGTFQRSRALWSTRKETLGSRPGFLSISDVFRDYILRVFGKLWNNVCIFCYACSQVSNVF